MSLDGITPILATSYDERDRIAFDDIARQVDHLAGLPVTAVGIGFGSDIVRLTESERDQLVRAASDAAAGRVRVLSSAGGNSIRAALDRAEAVVRAGASILMVVPPGASSSPSVADLVAYYTAIAAETGVPVMVQDAPGFTGTTMSAELLARLGREVPGVEAVKIETVPPAPKVGAVAALDHGSAAVLGGAGGLDFYHELERGADGTVPGSGMAELFIEVQRLHRAGDRAGGATAVQPLPADPLDPEPRAGRVLRGPAADPRAARPGPIDAAPTAGQRRPAPRGRGRCAAR